MSMSLKVLFCSLTIMAFAGCSGSGGGGGEAGNRGGKNPQNKEEALSKISSIHKQNFARWKQQVVKACDASDAFGLGKDKKLEADGIDGAALLQSNGGSVIFSDNGSLAILTTSNSFLGTGTSKVERTQEVNGQSYTISVETKRNGSNCEVYLFGQKVYETYIAESFNVGTQWAVGKQAQATSVIPQIKSLGPSGMSEVTQHGIYSLISQTLKPSKEAMLLLSKKFGLKEKDTLKFFKLSNSASADSAVRIENESSAIWSNEDSGNLIAHTDILKKAFDGTARTLPLEVRLAVPTFLFGETKNSADGGNLKLTINVLISKKDASFTYSAQAIELQGLAPFDKIEAVQCSKERATAYVGGPPVPNQIQPSVQVMFSPCRTLYSEIEKESYNNGLLKSLIPQMFAGVLPMAQFQYGGWDQVLSKLALNTLEQGKDLRGELDPTSRTRVVGIIADHLETLTQEIVRTKNMESSKNSVFQMGLDWSFNGHFVAPARIAKILQSVDNSIGTFKASSERLLADLGHQPNFNDDQLNFAQNIDGIYKAEATKALGLSKDLAYADFERDIFDKVIQKNVPIDEFKEWSTKFGGIKSEINKYSNIGPLKTALVSLSIKLLNSGEAVLQDLGPIYSALDNSIFPFDESSREFVRALSQSLQNNKEGLEFARSISTEYKQTAIAIRDNSKVADYESWGQSFFKSVLQKRPSMETLRSWNEMWVSILAFTQRERAKIKDEFGSINEWNRKKIIEVAVKETWTKSDFEDLEKIAEIARAKNTCDRYIGSSSLADCGGIRLFSKQKNMLLDPAWGGRYRDLSRDFAGYMEQLAGFDWTTLRWALVGEFFGSQEPIWSKCDQNAFNQKATALKTQVNAIVRESDQIKKWELERKIKDTISNCQ